MSLDASSRCSIDNAAETTPTSSERLTDGELYYRLQDYLRASIIFTNIVETYPTSRSFPDALYYLGESLYQAGDLLGARTRFRSLLERADQPGMGPYLQRTLGRLIEIAIRIRDFDGVEGYFQQLSRLPSTEVEATNAYYRAKYLYNRAVPTESIPRPTFGAGCSGSGVASRGTIGAQRTGYRSGAPGCGR